jgi:DNA-binding Lrp family transcriptional regulator
MVHAFIMVKAGAGAATDVCEQFDHMDGVQDAHVVAGRYDVIVEIGGDEVGNVLQTVSKQIGAVSGVTDTKTYISLAAA